MPLTITVDTNSHLYRNVSLHVIEQKGLDVMDAVTWTAVYDDDTALFATAMRAGYVLFHDREVGVLVSRRTLHAWYHTQEGRFQDKFGNTRITAPTALLVGREQSPAELVNIEYLAGPANARIPALPALAITEEGLRLRDTRRQAERIILELNNYD